MTKPSKTYRVGTFYHNGQVSCYTTWYNPIWRGCIEYEITASSGAEAKKLATIRRRQHEIQEPINAAARRVLDELRAKYRQS